MAHHEIAAHDVGDAPADQQYRETPPGAQYEHTDANVVVIVKFGVWLVIIALVIHVGLGVMYKMMIEQAKDTTPVEYPLASTTEPRVPPPPRLQQFPRNEIYEFRTDEEQRMSSYGWVNKDAGVVHIPIGEAMRLTLERGLPSRTVDQSRPAETPDMMPSDSSSGRQTIRRRQ
jgi:hypothetical protein